MRNLFPPGLILWIFVLGMPGLAVMSLGMHFLQSSLAAAIAVVLWYAVARHLAERFSRQ